MVACGGGSDTDEEDNTPTPNVAPIANAGEDQSVSLDQTVELSGSASSDADGDSLTYEWNLESVPTSSVATLNNTASINTNFVADVEGDYVVSLVVNDGSSNSPSDSVTITAVRSNNAPIAKAGPAQSVNTGIVVKMNGQQSSDPDGDNLTYSWTLTSQPAGSTASLNLADTDKPRFTTDVDGDYTIELVVNDGFVNSEIDSLIVNSITSNNQAPVANANSLTTDEDTPNSILLSASDADGDSLTYTIVSAPSKGRLILKGKRIDFIPSANLNGSDSFTFKVNDGFQDSEIATVSLTINPINDKPTAHDYNLSMVVDTSVDITFRANDKESQPLSYTIISQPTNGTVIVDGDIATYSPSSGYTGLDNFTFTTNDGELDSNIATITVLTGLTVNTPPVVNSSTVAVDEDSDSVIDLSTSIAKMTLFGKSNNFSNLNNLNKPPLNYSVVTPPLNGTVVIEGSNATFTPHNNFSGSDSFTFKSNDGNDDSNHGTITLNIDEQNDAPVAEDYSVSVTQDTSTTISLTATDSEFDELSYFIVDEPSNGTIALTGSTASYIPNESFIGEDSFTFIANDDNSDSNLATISITISETVNLAPEASDSEVTIDEDGIAQIGLVASDNEGDGLTFSIVSQPENGSAELSDGTVFYTPSTNYNGSDAFTFRVNDGTSDSNIAVVSIAINEVNDAPVVSGSEVSIIEDTNTNIILQGSDSEDDDLTFSIVSPPENGEVVINENTATYYPSNNYDGVDSFTFLANDGFSNSNIATISITVISENDAPVTADSDATTDEDSSVEIVLTATDTDSETFTYSIVTSPSNGSVSISGSTATYTPETDYNGSDSFTFIANDGESDSNTATVSLTINSVNDAPVADEQSVTTDEDQVINITLTASDVENDSLTYSIASDNGAVNGGVFLSGSNAEFTPDTDFNGIASFTFLAYDGSSYSETTTITITVNAINDAPVSVDDSSSTSENISVDIELTATDIEDDNLTYSVVSSATNGSVSISDSIATYTPTSDFSGSDSFTFKANDGNEDSNISTISITVSNVNIAPVANAGNDIHINTDNSITLDGSNSSDADGDSLTYLWTLDSAPANNTASLSNSTIASPIFTTDTEGNYVFNLVVNDGTADSSSDTVLLIVARWKVNTTSEKSVYIVDVTGIGTEVNVQSITDKTIAGTKMIEVSASGIPNYQMTMTQANIDSLNARPNASSDFSNSDGETTATVGQVIDFGEDIGYVIGGQGCDLGYWPSGPACPTDQANVKSLPISPVVSTEVCSSGGLGMIGYMLNGTAVYSWSDGASYNNQQTWSNNAPKFELYDLDVCLGHAQTSGQYHHHMFSECLMDLFNDNGTGHSPIYGYASDGFPIYGPYFSSGVLAKSAWVARDYDDVNSASGCGVAGVRSCQLVDNYDLSQGTTMVAVGPTTSETVTSNSNNDFVTTSGFYYEDYYYDADLTAIGGEYLDDHNGHSHGDYGYHYHTTVTEVNGTLEATFPYNIGPTFYGELPQGAITLCQ